MTYPALSRGSQHYPFSGIVADCIRVHGTHWTRGWLEARMPAWEAGFWFAHPQALAARDAWTAEEMRRGFPG